MGDETTATDVVVGAGSGMGAAIARQLAASGGTSGRAGGGRRLVLADLHVEPVERLAAELEGDADGDGDGEGEGDPAGGLDVVVRAFDLRSDDDADELAAAIGRLGRFVLTAGISPTMGDGRTIHEVDLCGPARLVRALEPTLGPGSVGVLFASMAAHLVPPDAKVDAVLDDPLAGGFLDGLAGLGFDVDEPGFAYALAKRGLIRLVQREALRWGTHGARLLSLSPGIVDTPMGQAEMESEPMMASMVSGSATGRMLRPDEIADVVAFLVSDAAAAMTATDVLVDGGAVAGFTRPPTA
jgi:NAD(P)-dependent dehydrogenase (short-subunit alcohol dehydrogenase family)